MTGLILPPNIAKARALQKRCQEYAQDVLWNAYPHHLFTVHFSTDDLSYRVDHMLMGKSKACMYIHPNEPDLERALIRAAGEMLERVNLPRKSLESWEQYETAKSAAKEAFECR